jgi:predicted small integral membrane protein
MDRPKSYTGHCNRRRAGIGQRLRVERAHFILLFTATFHAIKGAWGMSWRQKTMTGVEDCEKFGVVVKQTLIPKFPN